MTVYLVGAGPGDPGLITARGLDLVRSCDALVYDRLVSSELISEAPPGAIRVGRDHLEQAAIDDLLVRLGRHRRRVVRLKGGDPFVFGRGGEEALALLEAGIPFEVVPGVSSISAVPASVGIPITHRGVSSQVTVVSGHAPRDLDLDSLAGLHGTFVIFMGLHALPEIVEGLLAAGKSPETPAAVISRGSTPDAETVVAELAGIADAARSLPTPALVVVGEVVALRTALAQEALSLLGEPARVPA